MKENKYSRWLPVCCLLSVLMLLGCSLWMHRLVLAQMILGSYEHYLWDHGGQLLKAVAAAAGFGIVYRLLGRIPGLRKRAAVLAGIYLVLCSIGTTADLFTQWDTDRTGHYRTAQGQLETFDRRETVWELYGQCHFAGPAEGVPKYPDPQTLTWQQEGLRPAAIAERNRLAELFSGWRSEPVLLRVCLGYGYGAVLLYLVPVLLWTICMVLGWKRIRQSQRLVYVCCGVLSTVMLYGPILDGLGLLCCPYFLFGRIPCTARWQEILTGGLGQMVLMGCMLTQAEDAPKRAGSDLITRLLLCDKLLMGEIPVEALTEYVCEESALPDGIVEGEPFDGSLLEDKGFLPGRTYRLGPVVCKRLRPVILEPASDEDAACFEDFLITRSFADEQLQILAGETYYNALSFDLDNPERWCS